MTSQVASRKSDAILTPPPALPQRRPRSWLVSGPHLDGGAHRRRDHHVGNTRTKMGRDRSGRGGARGGSRRGRLGGLPRRRNQSPAISTATVPPANPATLAHGPGETLLTGTTAAKVKAAALAKVPGATVIRVETDSAGSPYEAHLRKADGSYVTVKVNDAFTVTAVQSGLGARPAQSPAAANSQARTQAAPARRTAGAASGERGCYPRPMQEGAAGGSEQLGGPAYLRLVGIGAAIGIPAALVAAGFLAAVHEIEHQLWTELPKHLGDTVPPWYLVIGLPVVGAMLVFIARRWLPGDGGHEPLEGLSTKPTVLAYAAGCRTGSPRYAGIRRRARARGAGDRAGLGSWRRGLRGSPRRVRNRPRYSLLASSFSAISALFGGPLVAGMLLMEGSIGLGSAMAPVLLPGLVGAACGYVIFIGVGSWSGLPAYGLTVPDLPAYTNTSFRDLGVAIAVGLASALLLAGIRQGGHRSSGFASAALGCSRCWRPAG